MKHINDIEMQKYIAGKLTAAANEEVQEHLAICRECSDRWRKAAELWDALGQWNVDTAGHDVAERVMALAKQQSQDSIKHSNIHKLWKEYLPVVLRVAASIIIAIGVGQKLGRYSVTRETPKAAVSTGNPEYLSVLSLEWSSELAWFILDDQPNGGQQ
jgi:predicted anti-sigma-YlaC factor YlaD